MNKLRRLYVLFRYDDLSARSNTDFERRLVQVLIEDQIPFVFGVIPQVCLGDWRNPEPQTYAELDSEKRQLLQHAAAAAPVDIALHGLTHQSATSDSLSEFVGLSLEEQMRKISQGARILEACTGHRPFAFVPPWNRYDKNTIAALIENGFTVLSAGFRPKMESEEAGPLSVFPQTVSLHNLATTLELAKKTRCRELSLIVELHEYDFTDVSSVRGVMALDSFRREIRELRSDARIELRNFSQALVNRNRWSNDDFYYPRRRFALLSRLAASRFLGPIVLLVVSLLCLIALYRQAMPGQ